MLKKLFIKNLSILMVFAMLFTFINPAYALSPGGNIGILVVAHGSSNESWNQSVREMVYEVSAPYPVSLSFLEYADPDIQNAVEELEGQGVDEIIAVPLFISSYSNHIEEIKYVLGLRDDLPEEEPDGHGGHGGDEEEELIPVETEAEIVLTSAIDDHTMAAGVLADRLETIMDNPEQEIAVLVGHGSDTTIGQAKWQQNFSSLADKLKETLDLKDARYGFIAMGQPAIRDVVYQAVYQGDVLVVPMMLSEGYFTNRKIPAVLEGLDYDYPDPGNRALLPHDNISRFVELRANDILLSPIQVRQGNEVITINYSDAALEEDGKICVCGSFAFRSLKKAIGELWPDTIPDQDDMRVQASLSHGNEEALTAIAGIKNCKLQVRDHSPEWYTYQITDKNTGNSVTIKALPEVFPENFFTLKKKVKKGEATPEERKQFKKLRSQVVEKVRWEADDQLFSVVKYEPARRSGGSSSSNYRGEVITRDGGIFTKYGVTVNIPPAAVDEKVRIKIRRISNFSQIGLIDEKSLISDVFEITKDSSENFEKHVTITIPFRKADFDREKYDISLFWFDKKSDDWVELKNVKVDYSGGKVSGQIDHLTKFAVLAWKKDSPELTPQKPPKQVILTDITEHWAENVVRSMVAKGVICGYPDGSFRPDDKITRAEFTAILVKALGFSAQEGKVFDDTIHHWAKEHIMTASAWGIINGYDENIFAPNDYITREQMAVMLVKAAKVSSSVENRQFKDEAKVSEWARDAVKTAYNCNIINGYPDGSFKPQGWTSRAEAVTVISNVLSLAR